MIINAGMVYYLQYKVSGDKMDIPELGGTPVALNKDHVYGLGAEGNLFIPSLKSSIALRWISELGARNRTQGNSFFITIAPYIRFFAPAK